MKKSGNLNHPKKGSTIKVEPIKELKDIGTIKKLLADNPRDFALFTIGINTNLRASDLLRLTAGKVRNLKPNDSFEIKEKKTKKARRVTLNTACIDAIRNLLASAPFEDSDYLFRSQRAEVLIVPSLIRMVKQWCKAINLKGNYGSHTLRKTWGYHQRVTFGTDLPRLMVCFNHSTQRQTLDYLCIQADEIREVYENEL
ncbi:tyrosine-type recombinase/integrase [bacterium]|nr:tyrosine-type recombinase/integrase [bacterium]